jgi:transcriptional regulator with XRE-family HTH domain
VTPSTFALRFEFARLYQAIHGVTEADQDFAVAIGVSPGSVTAYKTALVPPPYERVIAIARRCGVDPGWLAFGSESWAPQPQEFESWLQRRLAGGASLVPVSSSSTSSTEHIAAVTSRDQNGADALELPDPRKDRKLTLTEIRRAKQKADETSARGKGPRAKKPSQRKTGGRGEE